MTGAAMTGAAGLMLGAAASVGQDGGAPAEETVARLQRALRALAEELRVPVFLNGLARGVVPGSHQDVDAPRVLGTKQSKDVRRSGVGGNRERLGPRPQCGAHGAFPAVGHADRVRYRAQHGLAMARRDRPYRRLHLSDLHMSVFPRRSPPAPGSARSRCALRW